MVDLYGNNLIHATGVTLNPWCMHEGYSSHSVCECVCVSIAATHVENKVPSGFLWYFQDMNCVNFIENTLFKSYGDIC